MIYSYIVCFYIRYKHMITSSIELANRNRRLNWLSEKPPNPETAS